MPTLYALLVAIDNYPDPKHRLEGCVNDLRHWREYLEHYCEGLGHELKALELINAEAGREAVIRGFSHFEEAGAEDLCLFYFSGHGSRSAAPQAFHHLEADRQLESLVCYDSRTPGGYDLMDKELSFLIWKASQERETPFVSVMDCCHSGRMRDLAEEPLLRGVRQVREMGPALPVEQFHGLEQYKRTEAGQLSPPLGRRVHLAASLDTQLAREVIAGGEPRGVFTYCLIEALQRLGPQTSYAKLLNQVNLRIGNTVREQSAQIDSTLPEDKNRGFLFSRMEGGRPHWLVSWHKASGRWRLNAGAVHGLPAVRGEARPLLKVARDERVIPMEEVHPTFALVSGMDGLDKRYPYPVQLHHLPAPQLVIGAAADSDPAGIEALAEALAAQAAGRLQLSENPLDSPYRLLAREGVYTLERLAEGKPLLRQAGGYGPEAVVRLLRSLEVVANWQQLLELSHPGSSIAEGAISLHLYRVTEPGNLTDDAPVEELDWRSGRAHFPYVERSGRSYPPAFQLKLVNHSPQPLWLSLLYLGSDFSITNALLPKLALGPGQEAWVFDLHGGHRYKTIPLQIEDEHLDSVEEFFKLLISTEEFSTDHYNQPGLKPTPQAHRAIAWRNLQPEKDWAACTTRIRIIKNNY